MAKASVSPTRPHRPSLPAANAASRCKTPAGLKHSHDPVLDLYPTTWDAGTFRIEFDIMAQPGADWFFEMRNKAGEFAAVPYVRWQNGKIAPGVNGNPVPFDVPPNEWVHVTLIATTGTPEKTGTWTVSFTRQDGEKKGYLTFAAKPSCTSASYLLFSALGTTKTAFFIDNLKLEQTKP